MRDQVDSMEGLTVRELTWEDFQDIEIDPNSFQIDFLAAIAKRSMVILDSEEHRKKDKEKLRLSDSDKINEERRKEMDKGKRKLSDDHLNEQPRKKKKKKMEGKRNTDTLQPTLPKGVCIKEFPERLISGDREYLQHRASKGMCIKERPETVIRRSDKCKRNEDSLLSPEEIPRQERLLKRPVNKTASDHEYQDSKKVKKSNKVIKKLEIDDHGPNPPPELPTEFKETLQELAEGKSITELQLVIQKRLYDTDIRKNHNRLSMPSSHLLHEFLTQDETAYLKLHNGKNVNAIEADIIEPSLRKGKVSFRRWEMKKDSGKSSITYVFARTWSDIVSRNLLSEGDIVQVWTARVDRQLWFLLARVPSGEQKTPTSTAMVSRGSDTEHEPGPSSSSSYPHHDHDSLQD